MTDTHQWDEKRTDWDRDGQSSEWPRSHGEEESEIGQTWRSWKDGESDNSAWSRQGSVWWPKANWRSKCWGPNAWEPKDHRWSTWWESKADPWSRYFEGEGVSASGHGEEPDAEAPDPIAAADPAARGTAAFGPVGVEAPEPTASEPDALCRDYLRGLQPGVARGALPLRPLQLLPRKPVLAPREVLQESPGATGADGPATWAGAGPCSSCRRSRLSRPQRSGRARVSRRGRRRLQPSGGVPLDQRGGRDRQCVRGL